MGEKQQSSLGHLGSTLEMGSKGKGSPLEINVQRPAFTQEGFQENYVYQRPKSKGFVHATQKILSYEFSKSRLKRGLKARLPIVDCIRNYTKDNIVGDLVAGMTVGIMQIPLGMAYAILGNCPAVTGLYTSFFPVLIYFFLGTSRHISQGTFAITSLMFAKTVRKYATTGLPSAGAATNSSDLVANITEFISSTTMASTTTMATAGDHVGYSAIEVAASMALIVGILQLFFGFIRLGEVSIYMSDTLISGFTTGAAFLVFTSQFSSFFNIKVPTYEMPFEVVSVFRFVFEHFPQSNIPTMIVSAISLFVLAFTCEVINPWIMPKIKVPIPIELIAVVVGTGVSYAMDFKNAFHMKIVGEIPSGFPMPSVPPAFGSLMGSILGDSFAIAIVTFIISFSVAKILAKKYSYDINANQEFIAMGVANLASSFFSCFPMCVALSRTMVVDSVGGKSQMTGLLSCIVVLIVLVAIAPLFECLPQCVLAAIIVVGIRRMFLQFRDLWAAWKVSKLEALVWVVTFLAVVFIAIDIGLGIGVVFSLLTVVLRSQRPYVTTLGWLQETDLYVDIKKFASAVEEAAVKIYHYGGPILFANSKAFRKRLYAVTGVNPRSVYKRMEKMKKDGGSGAGSMSSKSIVMIDMSEAKTSIFENDSNAIIKTTGDCSKRSMSGVQNPTFQSDNEALGTYGTYALRRPSSDGHLPSNSSVDDLNALNASSFGSTDAICDSKVSMDVMEPHGHDVTAAIKEKLFFSHLKCLRVIVIDGSAISFVDFSGVAAILQVIEEYKKVDIEVYLAALTGPVLDMLEETGFYDKVGRDNVFPSVREAVLHFRSRRKDIVQLETSSSSQL